MARLLAPLLLAAALLGCRRQPPPPPPPAATQRVPPEVEGDPADALRKYQAPGRR
jgi:hypothetical protein